MLKIGEDTKFERSLRGHDNIWSYSNSNMHVNTMEQLCNWGRPRTFVHKFGGP